MSGEKRRPKSSGRRRARTAPVISTWFWIAPQMYHYANKGLGGPTPTTRHPARHSRRNCILRSQPDSLYARIFMCCNKYFDLYAWQAVNKSCYHSSQYSWHLFAGAKDFLCYIARISGNISCCLGLFGDTTAFICDCLMKQKLLFLKFEPSNMRPDIIVMQFSRDKKSLKIYSEKFCFSLVSCFFQRL